MKGVWGGRGQGGRGSRVKGHLGRSGSGMKR